MFSSSAYLASFFTFRFLKCVLFGVWCTVSVWFYLFLNGYPVEPTPTFKNPSWPPWFGIRPLSRTKFPQALGAVSEFLLCSPCPSIHPHPANTILITVFWNAVMSGTARPLTAFFSISFFPILSCLVFHMTLSINLSSSRKKFAGIFIGILLDLKLI